MEFARPADRPSSAGEAATDGRSTGSGTIRAGMLSAAAQRVPAWSPHPRRSPPRAKWRHQHRQQAQRPTPGRHSHDPGTRAIRNLKLAKTHLKQHRVAAMVGMIGPNELAPLRAQLHLIHLASITPQSKASGRAWAGTRWRTRPSATNRRLRRGAAGRRTDAGRRRDPRAGGRVERGDGRPARRRWGG